jgi:outer membrane protein assembly factor BamB
MDASPVIGPDGTVYAATQTGDVYSLNGKTGKIAWSSSILDNRSISHPSSHDAMWNDHFGQMQYQTNFSASPAISADGILYVGSRDDYLYAFDAKTGHRIWRFKAQRTSETIRNCPIIGSPTIGSDGTVYFLADKTCYAVDGRSGVLKWKYSRCEYSSKSFSSPVIGSDGTVFVACDFGIYAFRPQSGLPKWYFNSSINSDIALGQNDTIYLCAGGGLGKFIAIDGKTAKIKWQSKLDKLPQTQPDEVMKCPAIGLDGTVYATSFYGHLYAWNGATGKRIWTQKCDFRSYPVVTSDGKVYLNNCYITSEGKTQPRIGVFDGKTGKILKNFVYDTGVDGISSPIAITEDGTIIVDSSTGRLYAIH